DVVDRLLLIESERRKDFIPESDLLAQIDAKRNQIWGELLLNLNKMVAALRTPAGVKPLLHRLADCARLALLFAPMLGIVDMEKKLNALEASKMAFALDGDPLVDGLDTWLTSHPNDGYIASGTLYQQIVQLYAVKGQKFGI